MVQQTVNIEGSPGINCHGFCEFCDFKKVKGVELKGCKYPLPFKKEYDFGIYGGNGAYGGFKDQLIVDEIAYLKEKCRDLGWINISDGGARFCHIWFGEIIELLGSMEGLIHINSPMVKSGKHIILRKFSLGKHFPEMKVVE